MGAVSTGTDVMLRRLLGPLSQHYSNDNTVEIRMVRPGVVTADRRGVGKRQEEAPSLTLAELETICKGLANYRGLKFDPDEHPKLSCILPDGQIGRASWRERVCKYGENWVVAG